MKPLPNLWDMYIESMLKSFLTCTALVLSFSIGAQELDGRKVTETLCSPEFHGRGYVNGGDSIAAQYIAQQFERLGLSPLPGQKNYFQEFSFPVNSFPGEMTVVLGGKTLVTGEDYIVAPNSGSFNGEVELLRLDAAIVASEDALTNLVSELRFDNPGNKGVLVIKEGASDEQKKTLSGIASEMASIVPVVELYDAKFTWSVSREAKKYPHVLLRDSVYSDEPIVEMKIVNKFISNHKANNVIAYVPAKKRSKKYIFLTAHYDHLGRMGADTYFPGANDNASGTAIMLRLAEAFKKNPMKKYNVVFIAFAGEEAGLLGSKYYVDHPIVGLNKIRFLLNTDIMGSGEEGITVVNGSVFPEEFDSMVKINEEKGYLKQVKVRGKAANSDHYFFSEKSVPAFFIYTMGPNKNYHDIFDQYENLSFAEFDDLTLFIQDFLRSF